MNPRKLSWGIKIFAGLVLIFLALPILIIFPLAFNSSEYLRFPPQGFSLRWINTVWTSTAWTQSAWISFRIAVVATGVSVLLSLATAHSLVRGKIRFKQAVYALILLPMIVPNIISAISMYFFFSTFEFFGSYAAVTIGHTVLALPVAVIILSATMQGVDQRLEDAAMSLGASRVVAFRRITLPLIAPGIASASIFAFLSSFDELLVGMFLGGSVLQTLPVRIWSSVQFQLDPSIAAVSALLIVISLLALLAANVLTSRSRNT